MVCLPNVRRKELRMQTRDTKCLGDESLAAARIEYAKIQYCNKSGFEILRS